MEQICYPRVASTRQYNERTSISSAPYIAPKTLSYIFYTYACYICFFSDFSSFLHPILATIWDGVRHRDIFKTVLQSQYGRCPSRLWLAKKRYGLSP
jgi:hypothetical protein